MKEERIKRLNKELKYLTETERQKELNYYKQALDSDNCDIKAIAKEAYLKRGIDYTKLNKGLFNNIMNIMIEFSTIFKDKDSKLKVNMIIELIIMVLLLLLLKLPFDLVRDIGYDYLEVLSTNNLFYNLWNLLFLILYTITLICTFIVLLRNFVNKYKNS